MEIGENTGAEDLVSAQRSAAPATTQTQLPASLSLSVSHLTPQPVSHRSHHSHTNMHGGTTATSEKEKKWKEGDET
jgi:transcription initiation factor TFIID subunit TAF12